MPSANIESENIKGATTARTIATALTTATECRIDTEVKKTTKKLTRGTWHYELVNEVPATEAVTLSRTDRATRNKKVLSYMK